MRILPALLVSTVMASPVLAGSPEIYVPPTVTPVEPVQLDYFTGLSVYGGLTFSSNNYNIVGDGNLGPTSFDFDLPDLGGDGVGATLGVGYDFKVSPNVVIGAFADYTWVNTSNDTSVDVSTGGGTLNFDYELQQKSAWTIGARAGYTPSERTLVYGLLGWTRGEWEGDYDLTSPGPNASDSYDFDIDGYTLGLGIETYVAQNMTLRLEYRNTKFNDYDLLNLSGGGSAVDVNMETRTQTVSAVVAYRF